MKKKLLVIAMVLVLALGMAGCAKEMSFHLTFDGLDNFDLVKVPDGIENCATTDDSINVTIKGDGDFDFTIKDDEGKEHDFTLKCSGGSAEVSSDDLTVEIGAE